MGDALQVNTGGWYQRASPWWIYPFLTGQAHGFQVVNLSHSVGMTWPFLNRQDHLHRGLLHHSCHFVRTPTNLPGWMKSLYVTWSAHNYMVPFKSVSSKQIEINFYIQHSTHWAFKSPYSEAKINNKCESQETYHSLIIDLNQLITFL